MFCSMWGVDTVATDNPTAMTRACLPSTLGHSCLLPGSDSVCFNDSCSSYASMLTIIFCDRRLHSQSCRDLLWCKRVCLDEQVSKSWREQAVG